MYSCTTRCRKNVKNVEKYDTLRTHLLVEIARLVHVVLLHELDYLVIASVVGPVYKHVEKDKNVSVNLVLICSQISAFNIWS